MSTTRKITVKIAPELLERAQKASGAGITEIVRTGLQLVAASQTYARLRQLRGKVRFTRSLRDLQGRPVIAADVRSSFGPENDPKPVR